MRHALAAGWVAFVFLLLGASPAHFWLDSGEIAAAGSELGVMHPPGGVALLPWLRLVTALPGGTLGFRMAVASSACAAATVALLVALLVRRGAHPLVSWGMTAWLLCALTFVRQARVVEVYALSVMLFVTVLFCMDPAASGRQRQRLRIAGVFMASLGSWLSGELRLLFVPWLGLLWCVDAWRGRPWVRWAPLFAVAGTVAVLGLPIASARDPVTDWGNPETLSALVDHLTARSIRESFAAEILPRSGAMWIHNAKMAWRTLLEDVGPLGPVAGGFALVWLCRVERVLAVTLAGLTVLQLVYVIGINPMGIVDRQTGAILIVSLVIVVGLGLHHATVSMPRLRWAVLPLAWTILLVPGALRTADEPANTRSWAPHAWTSSVLDQLPPGSLLLTQSDDLAAGVLAARVLEGARPDVAAIAAQHLYRPRPDRVRLHSPEFPAWTAAANLPTEAARIEAAIDAHPVAVALEHPAVGVFERVQWWSPYGMRPLGLLGPGVDHIRPAAAQEIEYWLPRLPAFEDRKRLAIAISHAAVARVRVDGSEAISPAVFALQQSLQQVWPDHAAALVTLGALADRRGDTALAIAATERALRLEPARLTALTNLALYLARDRQTEDEAMRLAERAIALYPQDVAAWNGLARAAAQMGREADARRAQAQARSLAGDKSPVRGADATD